MVANIGLRSRYYVSTLQLVLLFLVIVVMVFQLHALFGQQTFLHQCVTFDDPISTTNKEKDGEGTNIRITTSSTPSRSYPLSSSKPVSVNSIKTITATNDNNNSVTIDLQAMPGIIFTSCCWNLKNETYKNSKIADLTGQLQERRVDARFIPMPCTPDRNPNMIWNKKKYAAYLAEHPEVEQEYVAYSAQLQAAQARGDLVAVAHGQQVNCNCCLTPEEANQWVEHALSRGNMTHVTQDLLRLQNKTKLHGIFDSLGLSDHMPKIYSEQEIMDRNLDYPLIVKTGTGTFGIGYAIVNNETELARELERKDEEDLFVEQIITGDRHLVTHYMSRPSGPGRNGKIVAFWCGYYEKESWKDKNGLYILGYQDKAPPIKRIECDPNDTEAFRRVLQHTNMYANIGCIDGKELNGPGTMKIFDWNHRMCQGNFKNIDVYFDLLLQLKEQID